MYFRSSNSIDHLHSKRDSAYSSFSTSSSIPECLASTPTFSPERSCSLEAVPQRGSSGEMQQADVHYVRTVYDDQQRLVQEHELSCTSAALLRNAHPRSRGPTPGLSRDLQGNAPAVSFCLNWTGGKKMLSLVDCSWRSLLPWKQWCSGFKQTQRGSHLGPGCQLQLL